MPAPFAGIIARGLTARGLKRMAFGRTAMGQLVSEAQSVAMGGGQVARLAQMAQNIDSAVEQHARRAMAAAGGGAHDVVVRYASKEAVQRTALDAIWDSLGPAGNVLRHILGTGRRVGGVQDELRAAAELLRAYGIENVSEILGESPAQLRRPIPVSQRQITEAVQIMVQTGARLDEVAGMLARRGYAGEAGVQVMVNAGVPQTAARNSMALAEAPPAMEEERQEVEEQVPVAIEMHRKQSSNVYSVGYDQEAKTLFVTYVSASGGRGPTYEYYNVPQDVFNTLRDAGPGQESVGVWVWELLRNPGNRIGPASPAAQERGSRWKRDESGDRVTHQYPWDLSDVGPGGYLPRKTTTGGYQQRRRESTRAGIITSQLPGQIPGLEGGKTFRLGGVQRERPANLRRVF